MKCWRKDGYLHPETGKYNYHWPEYDNDPNGCRLPDLVTWGTAVGENIAQLYNSGVSNMLLWTAEDEASSSFPIHFGTVRSDGTLRPFYYLIQEINKEFPEKAHIVSLPGDAGAALYGYDKSLMLLIPNFNYKLGYRGAAVEKTIEIKGLPASVKKPNNALYYGPGCANPTHICSLPVDKYTQQTVTVPKDSVALVLYSLQ